MAFKMKGHELPGPHQRKSPAKLAPLVVMGAQMLGKKIMEKKQEGDSPAKHFTGLDHSNTDPAHKTPPFTPSDTTTTKKETLPVGTLNEEKTKKWDGKKWVIIKKKR